LPVLAISIPDLPCVVSVWLIACVRSNMPVRLYAICICISIYIQYIYCCMSLGGQGESCATIKEVKAAMEIITFPPSEDYKQVNP
jgi:hypothetical protein